MKNNSLYIYLIIAGFLILSCESGENIQVKIPDLGVRYVVESYVMPDEAPRLLITRADPFVAEYDPSAWKDERIAARLVNGVTGKLYVNGKVYDIIREDLHSRGKYYNYKVKGLEYLEHNDIVELELQFPDGEKVYSRTVVPALIPIDSIRWNQSDKRYGDALYITFATPQNQYVRRQLLRVRGEYTQLIQDLPASGSISDINGQMVFASEMDFRKGDTAISRIYSINKEYYDYYNSVLINVQSNASPFVQPGELNGNVSGSDRVVGIFTAVQMADSILIIE